jgi:hypothetical protein
MRLPQDYGPEDFLSWCSNPLTQAFFNDLREDRQAILEAWGRKRFVGENSDQTLHLTAIGLAKVETIDELLTNLESSIEEARELVKERNRND